MVLILGGVFFSFFLSFSFPVCLSVRSRERADFFNRLVLKLVEICRRRRRRRRRDFQKQRCRAFFLLWPPPVLYVKGAKVGCETCFQYRFFFFFFLDSRMALNIGLYTEMRVLSIRLNGFGGARRRRVFRSDSGGRRWGLCYPWSMCLPPSALEGPRFSRMRLREVLGSER